MPTYGTPETAKDFPPSDEMLKLRLKITAMEAVAEEALKPLREKARILRNGCDHHFVPEKNATKGWQTTLVADVFNAGTIPELDAHNCGQSFVLKCTKCPETEPVHIGERCPYCGSETEGRFAPSTWKNFQEVHRRYFGHDDDGYNGVWLIECTNPECTFKAAGLRWDQ